MGSVLEKTLHLKPDTIEHTVDGARDLGKNLAMSWYNLDAKLGKWITHPLVEKVNPLTQDTTSEVLLSGATAVGVGVVAIEGLAGVAKLIHGVRHGSKARMLEGFLDFTAGAAIASTLIGVGGWPLVLGPIAAGLGVARGGVHAVKGYQAANPSREVQGFLDASRSAAVMCKLLSYNVPVAGVVGGLLGPLATAVQACRGYVTLRTGLEEQNKSKQIDGLADIGTATGLTLAFSGLVLPGIAVTVASAGAKLLYKVLPPAEWVGNKLLTLAEKPLKTAVKTIELTIEPAFQKVRRFIDEHSPWQHGEEKDDPPD